MSAPPKALRSKLHEGFADWLDGRAEDFDAIVAYHLEQGYRCLADLGPLDARGKALAERAAERLSVAGQRAFARGDTRAAANLLQRAVALLPSDDQRRLSVLPALGRALLEAGEMQRADSVLSEAVESGSAAGRQAVVVDAALTLAAMQVHTGPGAGGQAAVWRELEQAIPFYERSGDEAGLARALGTAGSLRFWGGEAAAAVEDLTRAARHARRAGESAQETESLQFMLMAMLRGPTPVAEALTRIEELSSAAKANRALRVHAMRARAELEAMRGDFETARGLIREAKELAAELGLELTLARMAMQAGVIELLADDAVAAEREVRPAYELLRRAEHWGYLSSVVPRFVDALVAQGRDEEGLRATELIERHIVAEDVDGQVGWRRVRARLLARRGELVQAERLAREASAIAERTDYLELRAEALVALAEVLHIADSPKTSDSALENAIRLYEQKGNLVAAERSRSKLAEPQLGAP